jgi:hypothetical protein
MQSLGQHDGSLRPQSLQRRSLPIDGKFEYVSVPTGWTIDDSRPGCAQYLAQLRLGDAGSNTTTN